MPQENGAYWSIPFVFSLTEKRKIHYEHSFEKALMLLPLMIHWSIYLKVFFAPFPTQLASYQNLKSNLVIKKNILINYYIPYYTINSLRIFIKSMSYMSGDYEQMWFPPLGNLPSKRSNLYAVKWSEDYDMNCFAEVHNIQPWQEIGKSHERKPN